MLRRQSEGSPGIPGGKERKPGRGWAKVGGGRDWHCLPSRSRGLRGAEVGGGSEGGGVGPEKAPGAGRGGVGDGSRPRVCLDSREPRQPWEEGVDTNNRDTRKGSGIRLGDVSLKGPGSMLAWRSAATGSNAVGQRGCQSPFLPPWYAGQGKECSGSPSEVGGSRRKGDRPGGRPGEDEGGSGERTDAQHLVPTHPAQGVSLGQAAAATICKGPPPRSLAAHAQGPGLQGASLVPPQTLSPGGPEWVFRECRCPCRPTSQVTRPEDAKARSWGCLGAPSLRPSQSLWAQKGKGRLSRREVGSGSDHAGDRSSEQSRTLSRDRDRTQRSHSLAMPSRARRSPMRASVSLT